MTDQVEPPLLIYVIQNFECFNVISLSIIPSISALKKSFNSIQREYLATVPLGLYGAAKEAAIRHRVQAAPYRRKRCQITSLFVRPICTVTIQKRH